MVSNKMESPEIIINQRVAEDKPKAHKGVRKLNIKDQLPDCEIIIRDHESVYDLAKLSRNKRVADIGCGFGTMRKVVEDAGGVWIGMEPFEGGAHIVKGDAENIPFDDGFFDVVLMHAVLEHVPNVANAFTEISRVLKPGGVFIGYVSFMESFHEISYTHMSFKSIEYFANENGLKLEKIGSEGGLGVAYNLKIILYPLPFKWGEKFVNFLLNGFLKTKANLSYFYLRWKRKMDKKEAAQKSDDYYKLEYLRQATGFRFLVRKK